MKKILLIFIASFCMVACSEARYVAHVAKQIPIPGEKQSTGHFKVGSPYTIKSRRYYPQETYNHSETGIASWYGPNFHGKQTANGEIFDKYELTAAHRTLQLPSIVRVTNLSNGRAIILRVNDRGPFAHSRVLDVSERAATLLGFKNNGTARVRIDVLPQESKQVAALARSGEDTRGFEVTLNNKPSVPSKTNIILPPKEPIRKVEVAALQPQTVTPQPLPQVKPSPSETRASDFGTSRIAPVQAQPLAQPVSYSDTTQAVTSGITPRIYVQAGAFSEEHNALSLSNRLSTLGPSKVYLTRINDRPFFRVRLGPYADQAEAQRIASTLIRGGNPNTKIVID